MDKDFSEGFMHDVADLLEYCAENNTDNVDLIFTFGDKELNVNVTFSIKQNWYYYDLLNGGTGSG